MELSMSKLEVRITFNVNAPAIEDVLGVIASEIHEANTILRRLVVDSPAWLVSVPVREEEIEDMLVIVYRLMASKANAEDVLNGGRRDLSAVDAGGNPVGLVVVNDGVTSLAETLAFPGDSESLGLVRVQKGQTGLFQLADVDRFGKQSRVPALTPFTVIDMSDPETPQGFTAEAVGEEEVPDVVPADEF